MAKTLIRNKDVAPDAGIGTDKLSDVGQSQVLITPEQRRVLTTGVDADSLHYHKLSPHVVQFGRNGVVVSGQYMETAVGIPSNVCGIPLVYDGQIVNVGIVAATAVVGVSATVRIRVGACIVDVPVPVGQRKVFYGPIASDFVAGGEMSCMVTQGTVDKPSVLVEFRWR